MWLWDKFCENAANISIGASFSAVGTAIIAYAILNTIPTLAVVVTSVSWPVGLSLVGMAVVSGVTHYAIPDHSSVNKSSEYGAVSDYSSQEDLLIKEGVAIKKENDQLNKDEAKGSEVIINMYNTMQKKLDDLEKKVEDKFGIMEDGILLDKRKNKKEMSEVKSTVSGVETKVDSLASSVKNSNTFFNGAAVTTSPNAVNDPSINEQSSRSNLRNRRSTSNNK